MNNITCMSSTSDSFLQRTFNFLNVSSNREMVKINSRSGKFSINKNPGLKLSESIHDEAHTNHLNSTFDKKHIRQSGRIFISKMNAI